MHIIDSYTHQLFQVKYDYVFKTKRVTFCRSWLLFFISPRCQGGSSKCVGIVVLLTRCSGNFSVNMHHPASLVRRWRSVGSEVDSVLTVNIVVTTGVSVADDPALVAAVVTVGSTVVDTVLGVYIVVVDIGRPVVEVSVDDGGGLDTVVFSDETVVGVGGWMHGVQQYTWIS